MLDIFTSRPYWIFQDTVTLVVSAIFFWHLRTEKHVLNHVFPFVNARSMPEKPVCGHFLETSSLIFSDFFAQRCDDSC